MEIQAYLRIIRQWLWLILIAVIIGGGVSFIAAATRMPMYQAQATVLIGQFINSPNPQYADILTGLDLATTYVELVGTRNVLEGAIDAAGVDITPNQLRGMISTRVIDETSLIIISVKYTDPVIAADLANALANQMVNQSPTNLTPDQEYQIDFLNGQIEIMTAQVGELQNRLTQYSASIGAATDPAEITRLTDESDKVLEQLNMAQANIAQFASTIAGLQQRVNSIQVVETAEIPGGPIGTSTLSNTLLGALMGGALALSVALAIDFFDDRIRTSEDASKLLALPVLGAIMRFGTKNTAYHNMILSKFPPMSPINENYRSARTNVLFTMDKDTKGVFVMTSANPQEGKTITACNLAISMAMSGMNVLLIDADLRRPKVHEAFYLENNIGLSTLLFCDPNEAILTPAEDPEFAGMPKAFRDCVQSTQITKLRVLTSGFIPSNPTEILASTAMSKWIEVILRSPAVDVILIDSPPVLVAADASVLAANVKAKVIFVIDRGATRVAVAKRVKEQLTQLLVPIAGVILNRINPREEHYGQYYGYYYTSDTPAAPAPKGLARLFKR